MGVPRLFPWLSTTFPFAVKHFQEGESFFYMDNLYIDAPSLLHAANQQVHNYGSNKRKLDPYKEWSAAEKQLQVFKMFFESIVRITEIIVPTKLLYIAIDGPAPLAKQAQQRQRRFVSAQARASDSTAFDSNSMTPGTVFMLELTKYLHTAIRKKIMEVGSKWRDLKIFFSSPMVPGEGEHKALQYIRALPSYVSENESHCIVGPDGDLIMLALAAHLPKIFLFREDQYSIGYYHLLDMGMVRAGLPKVMGQIPAVDAKQRTLSETSDDFILAGFFVGNDFLPKIQMFMFLEDGLELMLATCTKLAATNTLSKDGNISHAGFTRFIEELARREIIYISDQARIPPADPRFKNETLLRHITWPGGAPGAGNPKLNMKDYRMDYYRKAGIDASKETEVKRMCIDYLRSISWVFKYYVHGLPSWRHFYSWHYAPLMGDLAQVMQTATDDEIKELYTFPADKPSLPFVQLLSVLPPSSAHLLPGPFHKLLQSPESDLVKKGFYPSSFQIDYEGKTKEHFGIALLPFVNVDDVVTAYQPIADKLKNTYTRNSIGRPEMFVYDPEYLASYKSDYGDIPELKVRKFVL